MNLQEKTTLHEQLIALVEAELSTATAAQKATQEGAVHEESRSENDKDTRGLESTYLARGQAERVVELRTDLARLKQIHPKEFNEEEPISLGALIRLTNEDEEAEEVYLSPVGPGLKLGAAGAIKVVTSSSPLGRALLGRFCGDDFELQTPGGKREYSVTAIR
ncbi:MAG: GreA/GreB family elongation factor [Polyangiaceae bacterium]|nr:GreA/GreB family elongation factor [Polyangiaceae bacterium]